MEKEMIIVLDFGGQYNQLIARRVRECNVYCEVHPYSMPIEKIKEMNPKGIIFTGGPNSVYGDDSPRCSKEIFELGIPVLGICYGAPADGSLTGRQGSHRSCQRVRKDRGRGGHSVQAVHRRFSEDDLLDEPYRLY